MEDIDQEKKLSQLEEWIPVKGENTGDIKPKSLIANDHVQKQIQIEKTFLKEVKTTELKSQDKASKGGKNNGENVRQKVSLSKAKNIEIEANKESKRCSEAITIYVPISMKGLGMGSYLKQFFIPQLNSKDDGRIVRMISYQRHVTLQLSRD